MKKKDIIIVAALFAAWVAWPWLDRVVIRKFFPAKPVPAVVAATNDTVAAVGPAAEPALAAPAEKTPEPEVEVAAPAEEAVIEPGAPEVRVAISNALVEMDLSSKGAGVAQVLLKTWPATGAKDSPPVVFDFANYPAMAFRFSTNALAPADFEVKPSPDPTTTAFERLQGTLLVRREIRLDERYRLHVIDTFKNTGAAAAALPVNALQLGEMHDLPGETRDKSAPSLGVDTLSPGGEGVQLWAKYFPNWFKDLQKEKGLPKLPLTVSFTLLDGREDPRAVDWAAVKNRYFVQLLTPEGGAEACSVFVQRARDPREINDPAYAPRMTPVSGVAATLYLPELTLAPGESAMRTFTWYLGPKQFSELKTFGMHQEDVLDLGFWKPVSKVLLLTMNWIHDWIWPHNYGIAIILLTIIIRIVFWPITHKSTESMKKMQAIQPLVTEVRAKYKDNPQRQQQEIMALYKEHKVNPLGGCLPMLIQIPVFIALFVVLRSAIELRFSAFLWIADLSQPENLFAGVLPIPLNILPILMAATMAWQQKLTPSAGDPMQQKMMMIMPIMMLVFFYNFASGLSLYWTTNQVLMIVQLMRQRRQNAAKAAQTGSIRK